MEYERIHKADQSGLISPSKLRLKLIGGPHHNKKKDGSNSNSARTSPAKLNDIDFAKNSLLADDSVEEGSSKGYEGASSLQDVAINLEVSSSLKESAERVGKELEDKGPVKNQIFLRGNCGNSSTVHPVKPPEEDSLDYDSNASSSSFEFHKGQRILQNHIVRTFSRPVPSKWNDAEKWIVNRQQHGQPNNVSKRTVLQGQANRQLATNLMRTGDEFPNADHSKPVKPLDKFSFIPSVIPDVAEPVNRTTPSIDLCPLRNDRNEMDNEASSCSERHDTETTVPTVRSVSMRDMGTEMTPIPSQEPSRTATPVGATTPLRSPASSIPSTPRGGAPASTPVGATTDDESDRHTEGKHKKLTEQEMHLKTRREIVALGVQLGKMNIAAWASKDENQNDASSIENVDREQLERIEYENRAAAWEEAEKSKHAARYKREEIKIEAWESQQKAKLEAEMRRIQAQVEHMRANAHEKMVKKITTAKQQAEHKRAVAEAKRNRQAAKASAQAEYIRQTGRIPASHFICCSWL